VLGALVVLVVLAAMSATAYAVVRTGMYAHLRERLDRSAELIDGSGTQTAYLLVDERGHPLFYGSPPEGADAIPGGLHIVSESRLGPLAVLVIPSPYGGRRIVATPAGAELSALREFLRVLIALTVAGSVMALPVGYALAGSALHPLDDAVRERTEFVALASHQLRTPLSIIRTSAELAQSGHGVTPDEALGKILEQTQRMEALAARLTALARAEIDSSADAPRTNLSQAASQVVAALEPAARGRDVTIVLDAGTPVWVRAKEDEAGDLLSTILENAVQVSPSGSAVTVRVSAADGRGIAEVRDKGPGIRPEDLPHITEPFYQGQGAHGTSGLGLAIARAIVERRRGELSFQCSPEGGTTVRVVLPRSGGDSGSGSEAVRSEG